MTRGNGLSWLLFTNQVMSPAIGDGNTFPLSYMVEGGYLKNSGTEEHGGNGCLRDNQ